MVDRASTFISHGLSQRGTHVIYDQTVWPAPEAFNLATAVIRRGYVLPETIEHPIIRFESMNLALLFVAWGLAPAADSCWVARDWRRYLAVPSAAP